MWELRQYLSNNNSYHLFGVAETRCGPEIDDNIINIPGFSVLRQDRNTRGGGILIYIRENLKAKILCSSRTQQPGKPLKPEYIFCSVWEGNSTPTLVVLIYRPPDVSIRSDGNLVQLLHSHCSYFSHKIVMGDWNANLLDANNSDTRYLTDLMNDLSLKLVDTGPSNHTSDTNTWIDSIFIDSCDNIKSTDRSLPTFPSRHEIISVTINLFYLNLIDSTYTYKPLNKIKSHDLNMFLRNLDWSDCSKSEDLFNIDHALAALTNNLHKVIDKLAPDKKLKSHKSNYPWINSELRVLRSKRDATSRRYARTHCRRLLNEFLTLSNSFEEKSETARCAYMQHS